jgi:hypothetical protein
MTRRGLVPLLVRCQRVNGFYQRNRLCRERRLKVLAVGHGAWRAVLLEGFADHAQGRPGFADVGCADRVNVGGGWGLSPIIAASYALPSYREASLQHEWQWG